MRAVALQALLREKAPTRFSSTRRRELIQKTATGLLMDYRERGWHTSRDTALTGDHLHRALATDIDHDGRLDDYVLRLQSSKFAYFTLDAQQ
ncbi:MAG: hypothetical protein NZ550_01600 [Fimbriimonadales bacterium]|nr:hypothetical protein [Fimbriimonadales bacterium]MDW8052331.1 hypothetical protein [Armatimonadota bacterium]